MLAQLPLLWALGPGSAGAELEATLPPSRKEVVEEGPFRGVTKVSHHSKSTEKSKKAGVGLLGLATLLLRNKPKQERREALATHFEGLARAKLTHPDLAVQGPWDTSLFEEQRAQDQLFILEKTYGAKGHPALNKSQADTVLLQQNGKLLTWILYFQGHPIATASLTMKDNGTAELCRAAAIPVGTRFPDGAVYSQKLNGSGVQYTRLADFFRHAVSEGVWALETDLRISAPYLDETTGQTINGGGATQHINAFMNPFLIFTPKIVFKDGKYFIEGLFESRLFLEPENMDLKAPLYTPATNTLDPSAPSIVEITTATYHDAFGIEPVIVSDDTSVTNTTPREVTKIDESPGRFVVYEISGTWTDTELDDFLVQARQEYLAVELAVKNDIGNIALQRHLYKRNFIPTGVKPGGRFDVSGESVTVPTRLHFIMPRQDLAPHVRQIELASDYNDTRTGAITQRLFEYWREIHPW